MKAATPMAKDAAGMAATMVSGLPAANSLSALDASRQASGQAAIQPGGFKPGVTDQGPASNALAAKSMGKGAEDETKKKKLVVASVSSVPAAIAPPAPSMPSTAAPSLGKAAKKASKEFCDEKVPRNEGALEAGGKCLLPPGHEGGHSTSRKFGTKNYYTENKDLDKAAIPMGSKERTSNLPSMGNATSIASAPAAMPNLPGLGRKLPSMAGAKSIVSSPTAMPSFPGIKKQ